ncbi:F-box protein FBW2-like [Euphorbia lathyris]|uniref:F-box protein FBW2-like n=1 Tax=Euphorbia lathyris TaxID=212925 RepID=UPI0033134D6B
MANLGLQNKDWSSSSRWEELNPEVLALILIRIPIEERVGNATLVCKNWLACVSGSYCWSEIDIQDWCQKQNRSVQDVDMVARTLMKRSRGSSWLLSTYKLGNPGFIYAANLCGKNLKVLKMPMSEVTDEMVERHVGSLVNLSVLDISYCLKITSKGIAEFGNNCKGLVELRRNMPPPLEVKSFGEIDFKADDCEAIAIANTMSGLWKLEMCYGSFGDLGLDAILTNCKALSHLNIDGCWKVNLGDDLLVKCLKLEYFVDPFIDEDIADYDDDEDDDECSDSY